MAHFWRCRFDYALSSSFSVPGAGSGHGQFNYLRAAPRSQEERQEQRKAARLSLDTSAHGGDRYRQLLQRLDSEPRDRKLPGGLRASQSMGALSGSAPAEHLLPLSPPAKPPVAPPPAFPAAQPSAAPSAAEPMEMDTLERGGRGRSAALSALRAGEPAAAGNTASPPRKLPKKVTFLPPAAPEPPTAAVAPPRSPATQPSSTVPVPILGAARTEAAGGAVSGGDGSAHGEITNPQELESLMRRMSFRPGQGLSREAMAEGLRRLGYDLAPSEVGVLVQQLDIPGIGARKLEQFGADVLALVGARK
jgi:hypothetical protein